MNKNVLFGFSILIFGLMITSVNAVDSTVIPSPDLSVLLTNQNPNPVEPGDIVDIEIEIQNTGFADANNRVIEFIENEPFTLIAGEDAIKSFNIISARSSVKVTYKIKVDNTAITNSYDLDLNLYSESRPDFKTKKTVQINVEGSPKLIIENIEARPTVLEPSGFGDIIVTLRNVGTGTARQIQAELITNSTAIVPILSGGLQYIDSLDPESSIIITFKIGIDANADYKTYESSIKLTYKDDNDTNEETFSIGIPVTGTIFLDIIKIEPSLQRGIVRFEIANKGTTPAKSVEAKLIINDEIIGIDYISQIKANKQTTFDFPIITGSGKLILDYIGPGLEKNTIEKDVSLDFNIPQGNGTSNIIIVVIVIVVLYFLARKFIIKKKKK